MFISKPGFDHLYYFKNNQDAGFHDGKFKLVVDGCGSGKHSEVGAQLFSYLLQKDLSYIENGSSPELVINRIFDRLAHDLFYSSDFKEYLTFTFLFLIESEDHYDLYSCGDGFWIQELVSGEGTVIDSNAIGMEDDNAPPYYIYNYLSSDRLTKYQDGVQIQHGIFPKDGVVKRMGIATDGLRFVKYDQTYEFKELLKKGNPVLIGAYINKNHSQFKDDITIAW